MATIACLLREHVTLHVRSVDRMLFHAWVPKLQAWVPKLQSAGGLIGFLQDRGLKIPSPALWARTGSVTSRRSAPSRRRMGSRSSTSGGASRSRRSPALTWSGPRGRGDSARRLALAPPRRLEVAPPPSGYLSFVS